MSHPERYEAKKNLRARVAALADGASEDLSGCTTVAERVEMVELLSRRMWEISGRPIPTYARPEMPGRVLRNP